MGKARRLISRLGTGCFRIRLKRDVSVGGLSGGIAVDDDVHVSVGIKVKIFVVVLFAVVALVALTEAAADPFLLAEKVSGVSGGSQSGYDGYGNGDYLEVIGLFWLFPEKKHY